MKRSILFIGSRKNYHGELEYHKGFYYQDHLTKDHYIITPDGNHREVDADSVGQFSGKQDVYKLDIFENDIVRGLGHNWKVIFLNGCFYLEEIFISGHQRAFCDTCLSSFENISAQERGEGDI